MVLNGTALQNTPIAVDLWRKKHVPPHTRLFFLSHCHADHTDGLTSTWNMPIYCSEVTAKLLVHKLQVKRSLIRSLEIGPTHAIPLDHRESVYVNVTLIDANHCPGAVMFLFEGYFGSILYTADFRVHKTMIEETLPGLFSEKSTGKRRGVDVLYLDNTYCDPHCSFPTQRDARNSIVEFMKLHRNQDPRTEFIIGMRALGKETLLEEIAQSLETYIVVDLNRMGQLELLECRNVFTTNPDEGFVHVLNFKQVTRRTVARWNEVQPTIAILPTALYNGLLRDPYEDEPNIVTVPYSDHSSYSELVDFVKFVRPKKVLPIVKNSSHDAKAIADMARFDPYLDPEPAQDIIIPEEVQRILRGHKTYPLLGPPHTCIPALDRRRMQFRRRSERQWYRRVIVPRGVRYGTALGGEDDEEEEEEPGPSESEKEGKEKEGEGDCLESANDRTEEDKVIELVEDEQEKEGEREEEETDHQPEPSESEKEGKEKERERDYLDSANDRTEEEEVIELEEDEKEEEGVGEEEETDPQPEPSESEKEGKEKEGEGDFMKSASDRTEEEEVIELVEDEKEEIAFGKDVGEEEEEENEGGLGLPKQGTEKKGVVMFEDEKEEEMVQGKGVGEDKETEEDGCLGLPKQGTEQKEVLMVEEEREKTSQPERSESEEEVLLVLGEREREREVVVEIDMTQEKEEENWEEEKTNRAKENDGVVIEELEGDEDVVMLDTEEDKEEEEHEKEVVEDEKGCLESPKHSEEGKDEDENILLPLPSESQLHRDFTELKTVSPSRSKSLESLSQAENLTKLPSIEKRETNKDCFTPRRSTPHDCFIDLTKPEKRKCLFGSEEQRTYKRMKRDAITGSIHPKSLKAYKQSRVAEWLELSGRRHSISTEENSSSHFTVSDSTTVDLTDEDNVCKVSTLLNNSHGADRLLKTLIKQHGDILNKGNCCKGQDKNKVRKIKDEGSEGDVNGVEAMKGNMTGLPDRKLNCSSLFQGDVRTCTRDMMVNGQNQVDGVRDLSGEKINLLRNHNQSKEDVLTRNEDVVTPSHEDTMVGSQISKNHESRVVKSEDKQRNNSRALSDSEGILNCQIRVLDSIQCPQTYDDELTGYEGSQEDNDEIIQPNTAHAVTRAKEDVLTNHGDRGDVVTNHGDKEDVVTNHGDKGDVVTNHGDKEDVVTNHGDREDVVTNHGDREDVVTNHEDKGDVVTNHGDKEDVVTDHRDKGDVVTNHEDKGDVVTNHGDKGDVMTNHGDKGDVVTNHGDKEDFVTDHGDKEDVVTNHGDKKDVMTNHGDREDVVTNQGDKEDLVTNHGDKGDVVTGHRDRVEYMQYHESKIALPTKSNTVTVPGNLESELQPQTASNSNQYRTMLKRKKSDIRRKGYVFYKSRYRVKPVFK